MYEKIYTSQSERERKNTDEEGSNNNDAIFSRLH